MNTILLMEDSPEQLYLLRRNTEAAGREILIARSVAEAEKLLEQQEIDVVVADLRIEEGANVAKDAGLSVLKAAKLKDDAIQVILVTNYAIPEISKAAMDGGAFDFLDRNPSGVDFWPMLRAKVNLALRYRELLLRAGVA